MSAQPPDPRAGLAGPIRCPRCSAEVGPDQDWCLECGAPARTRLAATPNWRLPAAVLAVVVALAGAALAFAFVQLTDDDDPLTPAGTAPAAAAPPQPAPTPTAPPVTSTLAVPTTATPTTGTTQPPPVAVPGQTVPRPPSTGTRTTPPARTTAPQDQGSAPLP